jgi:tRNA(adenine34) deaminase
MSAAFEEAIKAYKIDEVPVGAVVTFNNKIIGRGFNTVIRDKSVTSHAELTAINNASQILNNYRLIGCDIYVTLEPCHMCAKAIVDARINNLYFSTPEPKTGAIISTDNYLEKSYLNHRTYFKYGIMQHQSSLILKNFFKSKRRFKAMNG